MSDEVIPEEAMLDRGREAVTDPLWGSLHTVTERLGSISGERTGMRGNPCTQDNDLSTLTILQYDDTRASYLRS